MTLTIILSLGVLMMPPGQQVTVTTPHGVSFAATWTDAGANAPAAVLFPMCLQRPAETWAPVAVQLQQRGISSLVITYPGWPGNSPWPGPQPPPNPQTVYWDEQFGQVVEASVAFVSARTHGRLAAGGSSCGVDRALTALVRHAQGIAGIVAFAGEASPAQLAAVRAQRTPVLAITTRQDSPGPAPHQTLFDASGHPASRLMLLDGSGHGTDVFKTRPELAADIAQWIAGVSGK
jgi:hypothetical protein